MDLRTRLASAQDAAVVASLLIDFNREFDTAVPDLGTLTDRFERLLVQPEVIAILAEIGDPVGFGLITLRPTPYHDGPLAQLDELYVVPDRRGSGVGGEILAAGIAAVRSREVHEMHINVDEIDEGARRFYERHGFTNIEPGADYRMLCYLREF